MYALGFISGAVALIAVLLLAGYVAIRKAVRGF